jgi:hypothetical protein
MVIDLRIHHDLASYQLAAEANVAGVFPVSAIYYLSVRLQLVSNANLILRDILRPLREAI